MSTLVERLEAMAESDLIPMEAACDLLREAAAALRATTGEGGCAPALESWERLSMETLAVALRERGDDLSTDSASWLEKWLAAALRAATGEGEWPTGWSLRQISGGAIVVIGPDGRIHKCIGAPAVRAAAPPPPLRDAEAVDCDGEKSPGPDPAPPSTPAQHWLATRNAVATQEWQDGFNTCAARTPPAPAQVDEGCTPADAKMLRHANHGLIDENARLREALQFYADKHHFMLSDPDSWDTVTGEPQNLWCDEAGTATVEDGSIARAALAAAAKEVDGG